MVAGTLRDHEQPAHAGDPRTKLLRPGWGWPARECSCVSTNGVSKNDACPKIRSGPVAGRRTFRSVRKEKPARTGRTDALEAALLDRSFLPPVEWGRPAEEVR